MDEPELGTTDDPRELVRGNGAAVLTTVERLAVLARGFGGAAVGLAGVGVGGVGVGGGGSRWTGAAADGFQSRCVVASDRWSQASAAFGGAARAWDRFHAVLVVAQETAATAAARFRAGTAAAERADAAYTAAVDARLARQLVGQDPGPPPAFDGSGVAEMDAARGMLAAARARRDAAAADAAREITAVAALCPDPPGDLGRRTAAATEWLTVQGAGIGHVAEGVGEGVADLVRLARSVNPADPYNLNHPARFVENLSTELSGAAATLAGPTRLFAGLVGPGWGSDPARAFGHLVPTALGAVAGGAGRLGRDADAARSAAWRTGASSGGVSQGAAAVRGPSLRADPRSTSPHVSEHPTPADAVVGDASAPAAGRAVEGAVERAAGAAERAAGGRAEMTAGGRAEMTAGGRAEMTAGGRVEGAVGGRAEAAGGMAAADSAAAERIAAVGRGLPAEIDRLAPRDVGTVPPASTAPPGVGRVTPPPKLPDPTPRAADHHDPDRALRARVSRADNDFANPRNSHNVRKAHLDARGDLVPADPDGGASIVQHVVGRRSPAKGDSPYSSFTAPGARAAARFGSQKIEIDVVRLQTDIDAGRLAGVEIIPPHRVQAAIQADADRIAGHPVDLYVRRGRVGAAAESYGLDAAATAELRQRMIDMANAQRHHEWVIRGVVPARYILGPDREGTP